ncbi:MAG TPA: chromate resistance protein ChrB domain-containing protein [Candidatus Binatia bacterium]|jgi:hypothetical protein|nr:chromate resistance protein ChrB domain-containing protein [Candidatus Binatia bacterium]
MKGPPLTQEGSRFWPPYLAREPAALVAWVAASTSIGSLILYLAGAAEFGFLLQALLIPGTLLLLGCLLWARRRSKNELFQRIVSALWAGLLATLLYDVVRVPAVWVGMPVFKAISYFGTVMLNQAAPSVSSEFAGWAYHLSNGIGFGLMYALLIDRPEWWTAVLWGLTLEGLMLLTPYAEVFGYSVSGQFLAITISAHVVYGLTLWAGLRFWFAGAAFGAAKLRRVLMIAGPAAVAVFGIGAIGAGFYSRFATSIPPSPPDYLGAHLYTTWDVLEPDRVASAWVWQRFIDRRARFYFVRPFSRITRGIPFDTPEAKFRRSATRSATENILAEHGLDREPPLARLAHMTHLYEITPWSAGADEDAHRLHAELTKAVGNGTNDHAAKAMRAGFQWLDQWKNSQPQ